LRSARVSRAGEAANFSSVGFYVEGQNMLARKMAKNIDSGASCLVKTHLGA
jgi:hypothetical protein